MAIARLSVTSISKSYQHTQILNGITLHVHDRQRVGLVGANGVGKSTLLKILYGEVEADSGDFSIQGRMGYLPQVIDQSTGKTLQEHIDQAVAFVQDLETRMRTLESQMVDLHGEDLQQALDTYGEISEAFERGGGYLLESRINLIFDGLGIADIPREQCFASLSGGEKARVGLALLLLESADLLLLDEPTNHLDFASMVWLETYLSRYPGGVLVVSHDRRFLNNTVGAIVEIDEHTRTSRQYTGNYDQYLHAKAIERRKWETDWLNQQEEIRTLQQEIKVDARQVAKNYPTQKVGGDKFAKGFFRGRTEVAVSRRVQNAEERLRRIQEKPIPKPPDDLRFDPDFRPAGLEGSLPLYASGLSKTFGERVILNEVNLTIHSDSRIVIIGDNGAGKSTLLKILVGDEQSDRGQVMLAGTARIGYLDQEQVDLPPDLTLFEAYRQGLAEPDQVLKSKLLSCGLFRYEEIGRKVRDLSSGQKRKLQIARLMISRANLLLLDEPTNAISFHVLEEFEQALREYPGPVVAVSHDRQFISHFAGEVWELRDGRLHYCPDYAAVTP